MTYFATRALTKRFGGVVAVNAATVDIVEGAINGLIGPNGSGKTTFFNLVTGMIRADEGEIVFDGRPIHGLKPHIIVQQGLGRTFQITRIFAGLTVLENMLVGVRRSDRVGLLKPAIVGPESERAEGWLERVGIEHLRNVQAGDLSYGQQRLLEIASLMMADPSLVLLDEPAGGVNPVMIEKIGALVKGLNEEGRTFLIVEHNMEFISTVCDHVICFDRGSPLAVGTPEEIQENPDVLEAYLGA